MRSLAGRRSGLTHVHGAVISDQRSNSRRESDQGGNAIAAPATTVVELGEHLFGAATGSQNPEGDDDGKQSADMQNENDHFDEGKLLSQEGVEQDREQGDGNHQQCSVPALEGIVLIVQHDQTLNDGSRKEGDRDDSTLPSHCAEPA